MQSYLDSTPAIALDEPAPARMITPAASVLPVFGGGASAAAPTRSAMAAPAFAPAPHIHRDATVETVEANGVIQKIIVICGCGERIEVHCAY